MRVLHVDTAREWRGGQAQLHALVAAGDGDPHVATPAGSPLGARLHAAGLPTHSVAFRGRWGGAAQLEALCRDLAPDLVAVHTGHAHVLAGRCPAPVVLHRRLDFWPSVLGRRRARRAAGIVAVSQGVAAMLRACRVPPTRIAVVPDGVDPLEDEPPVDIRARLGVPGTSPVVLAVGALVPHKGHAVLVDAAARLPGVHVAILGEGPLRTALGAQASALSIAHRVHLPGHRDDARSWLRAADVVCHPSLEEGLGQAVIEAALAGAAIVASRTGGLPEIVAGLGTLVPPGEPLVLAAALSDALASPDELRACARARRPFLTRRYSVQAMVEGTRAAYARFLG